MNAKHMNLILVMQRKAIAMNKVDPSPATDRQLGWWTRRMCIASNAFSPREVFNLGARFMVDHSNDKILASRP